VFEQKGTKITKYQGGWVSAVEMSLGLYVRVWAAGDGTLPNTVTVHSNNRLVFRMDFSLLINQNSMLKAFKIKALFQI